MPKKRTKAPPGHPDFPSRPKPKPPVNTEPPGAPPQPSSGPSRPVTALLRRHELCTRKGHMTTGFHWGRG